MPKGELFLMPMTPRYKNHTGLDDQDTNGLWADAYERYGLSLEGGTLSRLMTPPPRKSPVKISMQTEHGVHALRDTVGYVDERTLSLEMHITARGRDEFMARYGLFCQEILGDNGYFLLRTRYMDDVLHLLYMECTGFTSFGLQMAKFTLNVLEPHPEIRRYPIK